MSVGRRAFVALDYLPYATERAKERQGTRTDLALGAGSGTKLALEASGKARDEAAALFGFKTGRHISEAKCRHLTKDQAALHASDPYFLEYFEGLAKAAQGTRTDLSEANIPPLVGEGGTRSAREANAMAGAVFDVSRNGGEFTTDSDPDATERAKLRQTAAGAANLAEHKGLSSGGSAGTNGTGRRTGRRPRHRALLRSKLVVNSSPVLH